MTFRLVGMLLLTWWRGLLAEDDASEGMFTRASDTWLEDVDTCRRHHGMAVTDVDDDGQFDVVVAAYDGPNLVLRFNRSSERFENIATKGSPYEALMDAEGRTRAVAACDIDGDGREEIYLLNADKNYPAMTSQPDRLLKWRDGRYVDLFGDEANGNITAIRYSDHSVACLDRYGIGKYGFVIGTGASQHSEVTISVIEMDEFSERSDVERGFVVLKDSAKEAGLDKRASARAVAVGPLLGAEGRSDVVFVNEAVVSLKSSGGNFLFQNQGNGSFVDVGDQLGIADKWEDGRGIALADLNDDGLFDIVYGNWKGSSRLYLQSADAAGWRQFKDVASGDLALEYEVRSVLVADFDNDGQLEILFNNFGSDGEPKANKLFTVTSYGVMRPPSVRLVDIGDAEEPDGYGTGAVYLDVNSDGVLDLLLAHGELQSQPIDVYHSPAARRNHYLRVIVLTKSGAPARGASVTLLTKSGRSLSQVIDGGSGYLCQMEPVAHFGLGSDQPQKITIKWTDGKKFVWIPSKTDIDTNLLFYHPLYDIYQATLKTATAASRTRGNNTIHHHPEL